MKKRFIFKDTVLLSDLDISEDVLRFLKSYHVEILVYSDKSYEQMKSLNLYENVDILIPNTTDDKLIQSFSENSFLYLFTLKKDDLNEKRGCHILTNWEKYFAGGFPYHFKEWQEKKKFLKEFVFVTDSIQVYETSREQGFQSIYYEKDRKVITGRKIKSLSTLKSIYS